jgi:PAS domain S-box-containing protein
MAHQGSAEVDATAQFRRLALVAEQSGHSVLIQDADGRIAWVNEAFTDTTGYTLEEVVGRTPDSVLDGPETQAEVVREIIEAVEARRPFKGEIVNYRKDGTPYWCTLAINPVFSGDVYTGSISLQSDITDQKRLEDELRQSEYRSRLILENVRDVVFQLDQDGRWTYLNRAWQEITGHDVASSLGRSVADYVHRDDVAKVQALVQGIRSGGTNQTRLELRCLHRSGDVRWVDVSCRRVELSPGQPEVFGTFRDVTEAIQGLRALKEERDFNEAILQTASSLVVVLTRDGRIVRFNEECERVTGYRFHEVANRPFQEIFVPEDEAERVARGFARLAEGHFPSQAENHWVTRAGELRLIRWSNNGIVDEHGEVQHIIAMGQDITERRRTEMALKESQERYAAAVAGSSDGIWDWDIRQGTHYFSPRTLEMLGYEPGELPPARDLFISLLHPDDRGTYEGWLSDYLRGTLPSFQLELRVRHKSGDWRWFLVRGAAVWNEEGAPERMAGSFTDVTERKEQEHRLLESEARLEEAQALAHIGSWQYDPATTRMTWSANLFRIYGMDPEQGEPTLAGLYELVHPSDLNELMSAGQRTRDTLEPFDVTHRIRVPSGELYVRSLGRAVKDADGNLVELVGSVQDVTEAKLAELALKRSEGFLNDAQRLAQLGSWEVDLDRQKVSWSDQTFALFDRPVSQGEPTYSEFMGLLEDRSKKVVRRGFRDAAAGKTVDFEISHPAPHRKTRYLRVIAQPSYEGDRVVGILGSVQDVTEQKLAAQKLETQQAYLRNVIDTDPNLIFVKNYDGVFVLANKAVAAAYGTTPEEIVGKTDADYNSHPDEVARFLAMDRMVIDTGVEQYSFEERLSSATGERWLHTVKRPIVSPETGERQVLGISADITERVENQRELVAAREAALESSRLKSEFLANMSHEIRTPMNGVIGMSDLLLDSPLDTEQQELARTIRDSADSLLTILNDILDFSKIEAGKMSVESLPVDLADLLERVAVSFALRAQEKGIEFGVEIDWSRRWTYATDPVRLRQVLTNLVGNAVKFTERGRVTVRLGLGSIGRPRIEVEDTGVGIPADRQDAIFGAFIQADGSTTRKHGGAGLGLAIARQLVGLLGGTIGLESQAGEGSCFWVELDAPPQAVADEEPRLKGCRIAILSDDATAIAFAGGALASVGATLVDYDAPNDAILLDARGDLRELPTGRVIALLARGSSLPAGVNEAIYEPLTRRSLLDAVTRSVTLRRVAETEHDKKRRLARVLLVEDNVVNQQVAVRQLEREGLRVEIASNGVEAVALTEETNYDLVLMDVQMPEMDGLEATRRIRERDDATGRHLPIVAMTAHAMVGDRERCLEAGMDDYLSKPLKREDLREKLAAWVDVGEADGVDRLDQEYIVSVFGEDAGFLAEVLGTYVESTSGLVDELRGALAREEFGTVRHLTHTLKGSSRSIGAVAFAGLCERAEKSRTPEEIAERAGQVVRDAARLLAGCRTRIRRIRSSESS